MAPTMKQIALAAHVSQPAVSAVLNNRGNCRVSPETRQRILQIAKELNYQPNLAAQLLRGKKSNTVAIFTGRGSSALQNEALKLIFAKLQNQGFNCFTVPAADNEELKLKYRHLLAHSIEGFIAFFIDYDFDRSLFSLPQVHVGVNKDYLDIQEDVKSGSAELFRHLYDHGHRRFVFLCDKLAANIRKYEGIEETRTALPETTELKKIEFFRHPAVAEEIFRRVGEGFTAFLCCNDHVAARLCRLFQSRNIHVPEEVAVTGFDGMAFAEYTTPTLTTMRISPEEIAQSAVELLMLRMKDPQIPASIKIPVHFHRGGSCGCKGTLPEKFVFDQMLSVITNTQL